MKFPWGIVIGVVMWLIAVAIGHPAPIILWTIGVLLLFGYAVWELHDAYHDPDKKSLLMWGQFYFVVSLDAVEDVDNDRFDKRAFRFEIGFERPEDK